MLDDLEKKIKCEDFDESEWFDEVIVPKLKEIFELCDEHGVPYLTDFVVACQGDTLSHIRSIRNNNDDEDRFIGLYSACVMLMDGKAKLVPNLEGLLGENSDLKDWMSM